jgi:iron complex transport system ATP-binding protein
MDALTPLIEIKNATVKRGETTVFNNLSLELSQHESVAILGPNGAGKTTLLKLLTRDLYPLWREEPVVRILGKTGGDIWSLRTQLGIISNDLQEQYSPEVVGEQVVLSGFFGSVGVWGHQTVSRDQRLAAKQILDELQIGELAHRRYGDLSSGQQRRLILGRALINQPSNLILDEPTTGLDLSATFAYLHTMRELIRSGRTLVLVTHHIHEIPPEVSRVVLLSKGQVWADGPKESILTGERLSTLYGVNVALVESSGWYQAVPAA